MPSHPCDKGLTPACFRAYHKWAKQALAYKLTRLLLPKELSRRLPGVLRNALIGPGAILPPGLVLPPGTIVPPGFTWPDHWTPWQFFDFTTLEPPQDVFPPGWTPADPLPPGVTISPRAVFPATWTPTDPLPPGVTITPGAVFPATWTPADPLPAGVTISPTAVLPAGWTPADPPPPAFVPGYSPFPTPPESGAAPPIFIPPFEPGPVHPPAPGPALIQYTSSFSCTGVELTGSDYSVWDITRNTLTYAYIDTSPGTMVWVIRASHVYGDYEIIRGVFRFSLAALPPGAQMVSGYLSVTFLDVVGSAGCVQQAPTNVWGNKSDYLSFAGVQGTQVALAVGVVQFPFSADALAYIAAQAGGVCYLMTREHDHDYLDSPTPLNEEHYAIAYSHIANPSSLRPTLTLTYKA